MHGVNSRFTWHFISAAIQMRILYVNLNQKNVIRVLLLIGYADPKIKGCLKLCLAKCPLIN